MGTASLPLPAAAVRAGFPGLRSHRAALHPPCAAGGMLLLLLPLLRELRGPHVPEAGPADGLPAPGALGLRPAGLRSPLVSALPGRLWMGPRGGWKRRRLAAVSGSCHCSQREIPARRDKGEEAAAVGSWPWGGCVFPTALLWELRVHPTPSCSPVPHFPVFLLSGPLAVCRDALEAGLSEPCSLGSVRVDSGASWWYCQG